MASTNLTSAPVLTASIPQAFIIEALRGPTNPRGLLDRFPDEVYNKAPESHLMRFMYVLLGPAGVGGLRKNYLDARLQLEAGGFELFELDRFYGDPLAFSRTIEELYDNSDLEGLVDRDTWEKIKARDALYRSRVMDFLGGVRLGNTPAGMRLVARSGLGHEVEIVENYRYLYDIHSDDPVGYEYYGKTLSTQEFIVLPRQAVSQSAVQTVTVQNPLDGSYPTGGYFALFFDGLPSTNIPYNGPARSTYINLYDADQNLISSTLDVQGVQEALEAIPTIGEGQVRVEGGPPNPYVITFTGALSSRPVPTFTVFDALTPTITDNGSYVTVRNVQGGIDATDEIITVAAQDVKHLQEALDHIRPVNTIPTIADAQGTRSRQPWNTITSTSSYQEVLRFVTGNQLVDWPALDARHWIEAGIEHEAPRPFNTLSHHYIGFHNPVALTASSERVGGFAEQVGIFPFFAAFSDPTVRFTADRAQADYPDQPLPTADDTILGIYPAEYTKLSGVPTLKYNDEHFWSSADQTDGVETLDIDLGYAQAVNYLAFEITRKPIDLKVYYDSLDQDPDRRWVEVTGVADNPDRIVYNAQSQSPWDFLEFHFTTVKGELPFTRFIRVEFTRRAGETNAFLFDSVREIQYPWSIDVKSLRVGRNVGA